MRALAILVTALFAAGCGASSQKNGTAPAGDLDPALEACARGDLDTAEELLRDRRDPESIRLRARFLLMRNRNREAIELLKPLLQGKAKTYEALERQQQVLPDLALAYVRQDDFLNASQIYAMMGEAIIAKKYDTLARTVAYSSNLEDDGVSVEFHVADPVPVVAGTVNGMRALFAIDTMLDEIVLDRQFARRANIQAVALRGAGSYDEATALEIGLGRAAVKNVPIHLGDPMDLGRLRVDGVIGLQFLMHFDFTLDYRRSRLILRKAGGTIQGLPAYRVGDRYLLLGGTMNGKDKIFVGVGSSLRGVTLAASELFLQSQGGEIREVSAGPLKLVKPALDLKAFPAGLDGSFGLPIGFVLGHSALRGHVLRVEPRSMKIAIE
jgi:hypothetical protein